MKDNYGPASDGFFEILASIYGPGPCAPEPYGLDMVLDH